MSQKLCSLYDLGLLKVVHLIRNSYWTEDQNPFTFLPSVIINQLLNEVMKMDWKANYSDLKLLLLSNRLSEFIFEIPATQSTFWKIIIDLSTACDSLKVIKILSRSNIPTPGCDFDIRDALNILFRKAQNIEEIESKIEFDLSVLRNLTRLKKLVLDFYMRNNLLDMMNGENLKSLKYLSIPPSQNTITYLDIATILKHCPNLVHLNWDISLSLLELHNKNQSIEKNFNYKYKLQHCILGSAVKNASEESIQIASLTCPYVNDLNIFPNTYGSINALKNFNFLVKLDLHLSPHTAHISSNFWIVLKESNIGYNLKILILKYFKYANFTLLGECSPNLEDLHICYSEDISEGDFSSTCFNKLRFLIMIKINDFSDPTLRRGYCKAKTLVGILSNATNLENIRISAAGELTDEILQKILEKNTFEKLEKFDFAHCNLSWNPPWDLITNLAIKCAALRKLNKKEKKNKYIDYIKGLLYNTHL